VLLARIWFSCEFGSHSPASEPINGRRTSFLRGGFEGETNKFDRFAWKGVSLPYQYDGGADNVTRREYCTRDANLLLLSNYSNKSYN
jgi:hypothetical protein